MKKYIISYLPSEYVIQGIFIPKKGYTQEELAMGKREVVVLTEQQVAKLMTSSLFQTFLETKKMRILDKAPEGLLSGEERMAQLLQENAVLKAQLGAPMTKAEEKAAKKAAAEAAEAAEAEEKAAAEAEEKAAAEAAEAEEKAAAEAEAGKTEE